MASWPGVPTVGTTLGPAYAVQVNDALTYLFQAIPPQARIPIPSGVSVQGNLDFAGFAITDLAYLSLNRGAVSTANTLNVQQKATVNELFWNDNKGHQVQLTSNGAVNAAQGNITNLMAPAAVTWTGGAPIGSFSFTSTSALYANLLSGPISLFDTASGPPTQSVTLASPSGLTSGYATKFPAAQAAPANSQPTSLLSVQGTPHSGEMAYVDADNASLQIVSASSPNFKIQVKNNGVTDAMLQEPVVTAQPVTTRSFVATNGSNVIDSSLLPQIPVAKLPAALISAMLHVKSITTITPGVHNGTPSKIQIQFADLNGNNLVGFGVQCGAGNFPSGGPLGLLSPGCALVSSSPGSTFTVVTATGTAGSIQSGSTVNSMSTGMATFGFDTDATGLFEFTFVIDAMSTVTITVLGASALLANPLAPVYCSNGVGTTSVA